MAPQPITAPETRTRESALLARLLKLYEEESRLYNKVLDLSQRQGDLIREGACLTDVRRLLEQKKNCLAVVGRLELTERGAKVEWERGRSGWTAVGRARLHEALKNVTELIEEILSLEEQNDRDLIDQAQGV